MLKILQLQPELEFVKQFIENDDYKYVTVSGRGTSGSLYSLLEPLIVKFAKATSSAGHVDEVVNTLLTEEYSIDLTCTGGENERLPPRKSQDELDADSDSSSGNDEEKEWG
ncbi:hypothetical protein DVH05_000518 [Phytophthora capsici]|nr:hypothetical protein DVH05_000518 [Phytophthora capsici]